MAGHSYLAVTDTGFDASGSIYNAISLDELNTIIRGCKANLKLRFFEMIETIWILNIAFAEKIKSGM